MLQKVFKSVILSWLFLLVYFLFGSVSDYENDYQIILPIIMVPLAGGLSGFVSHLIDRSQSNSNANPYFLNAIKITVFVVLVGIAFVLGLNGHH
ncbi:hypothetical protein MMU07_01770 [Aquiflexum sp. LQ15W]|uniref:hypothetical protein n=1 Tax=Cognataquiflexum nitidum TaxID=2922272 RepID=UPI001F1442FB|nr:hypothetical protein [Cognataquiflexum nitidum]MCH6198292.1 hypothetical protein [Cognataquiflexum nitidum]